MSDDPERTQASRDARRAAETASLHRVQRRVGAIGFFAVTVHAVFGVIGAAYVREGQGRHVDAVVLTLMSGVIAVIVYVVMRIILGARLWSPAWIVLALLPTMAALIWVV
jgi:hypothetical protein